DRPDHRQAEVHPRRVGDRAVRGRRARAHRDGRARLRADSAGSAWFHLRARPGRRTGWRSSRRQPAKEYDMTLFMDIHEKVEGLTAEAVGNAHKADLETQGA